MIDNRMFKILLFVALWGFVALYAVVVRDAAPLNILDDAAVVVLGLFGTYGIRRLPER